MIRLRPAHERGHANHGWLDTYFSFSFSEYHDPAHMHFRSLRVLNDDRIGAGAGFPMHPHRDMEIITVMLDGQLEHRDSMGNGGVIRAGEIQKMSAGTGILHSEANPSPTDPAHLLQVWILPDKRGYAPEYDQRAIQENAHGSLNLIGSRTGRDGSIVIHQDVDLLHARIDGGQSARHDLEPGRYAWIQVASGQLTLNGTLLSTGDGAAISEESTLALQALAPSEILLFDLA